MKNTFILLLLSTYLLSATNLSIGVHECGGEKSYSICGISLNFKCECDHEDKDHKSCCSDETIQLKANESDKLVKKEASIKKFVIEYVALLLQFANQFKTLFHYFEIVKYEMPTGHSPPLYILYRVFRI